MKLINFIVNKFKLYGITLYSLLLGLIIGLTVETTIQFWWILVYIILGLLMLLGYAYLAYILRKEVI